MRIALDAMGGDYGPTPNLDGAIAALKENPDLQITLVGDSSEIQPFVAQSGFSEDRLVVAPSEGWVEMCEKPVDALRKKPNCSIIVCWQLMATQKVDAVVSAGNTGAVVAAGLRAGCLTAAGGCRMDSRCSMQGGRAGLAGLGALVGLCQVKG